MRYNNVLAGRSFTLCRTIRRCLKCDTFFEMKLGCRPDLMSGLIMRPNTVDNFARNCLYILSMGSLQNRPKSPFNSKSLVTISLACIVQLSQTKENVLAEIMMTVQ